MIDIGAALDAHIPKVESRRVSGGTSKIVTLDIERIKGVLVHEFWDLSDAKRIGRFDYGEVTDWPRTILVCWKDYFTRQVEAASEWADGQVGMLAKVWGVLDSADIIVGHNVERFDLAKLNGAFLEQGWGKPSPYKVVDTLKIAKPLGYESNTLGALTQRFGIESKNDRYDHDTAKRALAGHGPSQKRLVRYCKGDVIATEGLWDYMRPYDARPPQLHGLSWHKDFATHCAYCASTRIEKQATGRLAVVLIYPRWRCLDCGGQFEETRYESRVGRVRGIK